jgi:MFS family permease
MSATMQRPVVTLVRRRRLIALLALGQAVASGSIPIGMTLGTAASIGLTGQPALAGMFIAIQMIAGAGVARIAGTHADDRGRRPVLIAGFAALALGTLLAALAIETDSVALLVLAACIFGVGTSLVSVVRTAASDLARAGRVGSVVGLVATGGAIGGIAGPLLVAGAARFRGAFDPAALALLLVAAAAVSTALLMAMLRPDPRRLAASAGPSAVARATRSGATPRAPTAAAAVAAGVMMAAMTLFGSRMATGLASSAAAFALSAHALGMFGFALPLGLLADRTGHRRLLIAGTVLAGASTLAMTLVSSGFALEAMYFAVALGWSSTFVAGTAAVVERSDPARVAVALARHDVAVAAVAAGVSLTSGFALAIGGRAGLGIAVALLSLAGVTAACARNRAWPEPT